MQKHHLLGYHPTRYLFGYRDLEPAKALNRGVDGKIVVEGDLGKDEGHSRVQQGDVKLLRPLEILERVVHLESQLRALDGAAHERDGVAVGTGGDGSLSRVEILPPGLVWSIAEAVLSGELRRERLTPRRRDPPDLDPFAALASYKTFHPHHGIFNLLRNRAVHHHTPRLWHQPVHRFPHELMLKLEVIPRRVDRLRVRDPVL